MSNIIQFKSKPQVFGAPGLIAEVQLIEPETAAQWLRANQHNRPVRRRHVEFLAGEIRDGNWQLNGQAIIVSEDEEILDGQHRLLAIIEAGIAIKTLVIYGINKDAFKTIDTGAVRSGPDALALWFPDANRGLTKAVGSAVNYCLRMEMGFRGQSTKVSNTEVLSYVSAHPSLWKCAEILQGYPRDARPLSLGAGTAAFEMFQRKSEDIAEEFMRRFYTGERLGLKDAEYVLRQMLIKDAQRLTSYPMDIKLRMVVKAWNWCRRGRGDEATRQAIALGPHEPDRLVIL